MPRLDEWGIDEVVLFPQLGFMWEYTIAHDLDASLVNMAAWNRYAAEVVLETHGRLHPTGHVSLQADEAWLDEQLRMLSAAGIKLAMCVPGLVHGKRLSHPDVDFIWRRFVEHGVSPAWHVNSQMTSVLQDWTAWCENDNHSSMKLVTTLFQRVAAEVALCDLACNGVFHRYPTLQVVLAELGSEWLPAMFSRLDRSTDIYWRIHGANLDPSLALKPSEYMQRQVKVICSFPGDITPRIVSDFEEMIAFGGDYPHPEGLAEPYRAY